MLKNSLKNRFKYLGLNLQTVLQNVPDVLLKNYMHCAFISIILGFFLKLNILQKIVLFVNSFIDLSSTSSDNFSTFLSTSSTILITIFTIIFVLLTLLIQLSNRSYSFDLFLDTGAKSLMGTYLLTIILTLLMLNSNYRFPVLILILTVFCILSLYPFLKNINSKLNCIGLEKLGEDLSVQIDSQNQASSIPIIKSIGDLGIRILKDGSLDDFWAILNNFKSSLYVAKNEKMDQVVTEIGSQYIKLIHNIVNEFASDDLRIKKMRGLLLREIYSYMRNYSEIVECRTLSFDIMLLQDTGLKMIKSDYHKSNVKILESSIYHSFYSIHNKKIKEFLGSKEINNDINLFENDVIEYLGELAKESFEKNKFDSSYEAIIFLWNIGSLLYKEKKESTYEVSLSSIIKQLHELQELIGNDRFDVIFNNLKLNVNDPEIQSCLEQFKLHYSNHINNVTFYT